MPFGREGRLGKDGKSISIVTVFHIFFLACVLPVLSLYGTMLFSGNVHGLSGSTMKERRKDELNFSTIVLFKLYSLITNFFDFTNDV